MDQTDKPLDLEPPEISRDLAAAFQLEQNRIALRGHALWCASITFAEKGFTGDTTSILDRADEFIDWLTRTESAT